MQIRWTGTTAEALLDEYRHFLSAVREHMLAKIAEADRQGDQTRKQTLRERLRQNTATLAESYQARLDKLAIEPADAASLFDHSLATVNLDHIVYDGDRDYQLEFAADPLLAEAHARLHANNPVFKTRRELLKISLRLSAELAPELYAVVERCRRALGLTADLELYVYQDEDFNASCYPPNDRTLYILLTSSLLEKFDDDEIAFVIGHEIGHALFNHHNFAPDAVMKIGGDHLSPLHRMKLYAWKRNAEISADRVGLLCCRDYEAAVRSFFKLSSGVTSNEVRFNLPAYVSQFADLRAEMVDAGSNPSDWFQSHPFSPLRIKALELFSQSETYHRLIGRHGGRVTEESLEQSVREFLQLMEPFYIKEATELGVGRVAQDFFIRAAYRIAIADGELEEAEVQAMASIVHREIFDDFLREVESRPMDERAALLDEQIPEGADRVNAMMSHVSKLNMVKDLVVISAADGEVEEQELPILYGLCELLNIAPGFIDHVLQDTGVGVD